MMGTWLVVMAIRGRRGINTLHTYAARAELDNMLPDITFSSLDIPFELLKTRREQFDFVNPWINHLFVRRVKISILFDEIYFPNRELIEFRASIAR